MRTRNSLYNTSIDFEEASKCWNENKRRVKHGYEYICGAICKNKFHFCQKRPVKNSRYCIIHLEHNN